MLGITGAGWVEGGEEEVASDGSARVWFGWRNRAQLVLQRSRVGGKVGDKLFHDFFSYCLNNLGAGKAQKALRVWGMEY